MSGASFPFSAVVGLSDMRLALLLNAVSPAVGGVLVRGEKGTAKSTMVRALAALLPALDIVPGCRFSCDPAAPAPGCPDGPHAGDARRRAARLVELPIGASEDRLLGSIDLERALRDGETVYEPGLLAAAHRGVLYVDEVNLLHDHLVDLLLDAAAAGVSHVERDSVSIRHPARFLLVGTMNPEEGELRPQLLDRFGLTVEVAASREPPERAEVVRRRLAFDADPDAFTSSWLAEERALADRIADARRRLPTVRLTDPELERIARVCATFEVDGMRADLVMARAAIALAAWHERTEVSAADIRQAALLALPHRRRRDPFDAPGLDEGALDEALAADQDDEPEPPDGQGGGPGGARPRPDAPGPPAGSAPDGPSTMPEPAGSSAQIPAQACADAEPSHTSDAPRPTTAGDPQQRGPRSGADSGGERIMAVGKVFRARRLIVPGLGAGAAGRRSRARTTTGHVTGAQAPAGERDRTPIPATLHFPATMRAAAPHQRARGRTTGRLLLRGADLRAARTEGREGNLVLFCVDASGSMAARQRMSAVKGAVLSLLLDAYQRRDKVGLVTFRGVQARLELPPTWSVEAGAARLAALPTGGRTPLAAGLLRAHEALRVERLRDPRRRALLVLVTDGRATGGTDPIGAARRAARLLAATLRNGASVVVDCEDGVVRLGMAQRLAVDLGGQAMRLHELAADTLAHVVRQHTGAMYTHRGQAGRADRRVA